MGLKIDIRNMYCAYLPATETALYIVPNGRRAILKSLNLANETNAERTINLRIVRGSGHARLVPCDFKLSSFCMAITCDSWTMESGDRLFGVADQQMSVTLKASGVEEIL